MNTGTPLTFAQGALQTQQGIYLGLTLRDTSGAVNAVTIYDNPSAASGTVVATVVIPANGERTVNVSDGIWFQKGLFLASTSASIVGSIYIG